ncbi:hypothetical protein DNTS_001498 [Danionella cerebrum]|uniref:J domain-containing protein n=1 Tax=Danionella cerebrum TaxID=2873325 RepID=A0A553R280_9TELE|nr:hypothetical protein DNTS_001498 [Danionella translucida]
MTELNLAPCFQIKKAYRQRALSCHPDKNPDNPKAAELFHQLSQALEVLTDAAAKAAYDKVRAAKKQAEARNRNLDDKRKKIKLDLEARERAAENVKAEDIKITRTLEEEIARLREQGSRELQEQQRLIQEQIQKERGTHTEQDNAHATIAADALGSSGDSEEICSSHAKLFSTRRALNLRGYGEVLNVLISKKKRGSAVVEFASAKAAVIYPDQLTKDPSIPNTWPRSIHNRPLLLDHLAQIHPSAIPDLVGPDPYSNFELACKNENGLMGSPLTISWLEGKPAPAPHSDFNASQAQPHPLSG